MALIRNTASMRLKGRVGNTTYYTEGGRLIARVSQNSSNYGDTASRTELQQNQRAKWGNLVNFYKLSKGWMKKAYENRKANQSDYNRFMQLNTAFARVYLTKDMYAQGGCVVDAFRISEGSLRSIQVLPIDNKWLTDLSLGELAIDNTTTVGSFSQALISNNNHLHNNMQISFISYQQDVNQFGTPQLICTAYEVTLDTESTAILRDYLPVFCSSVVNGYLGTSNNISFGAFAYVLSESVMGRTLVSTQMLITNNETLLEQYTSNEAIANSIASYGVDADVFLASGSVPTGATPQPFFISHVSNRFGDDYPTGEDRSTIDTFTAGGDLTIQLSKPITSVTYISIWGPNDVKSWYDSSLWTIQGSTVTLKSTAISSWGSGVNQVMDRIEISTDKGVTYIIFNK